MMNVMGDERDAENPTVVRRPDTMIVAVRKIADRLKDLLT